MQRGALTRLASLAFGTLESSRNVGAAVRLSSSLAHSKDGKTLHPDLLNEHVKRAEYAVRGELYLRAMELQKEGMKITFTNGALRACVALPALRPRKQYSG